MLNEEARVREAKKAEIDRATNEQMKVLQNTPMGDSSNMNQWALKYAADAQKQLLMLNAALKSGQLKPQDYTLMRQNLADGTDQAFSLVQDYQNEYADKMARLKSNDPNASSQYLEQYLMETAEGFGNFNKSELVIDPLTGNVLVGFKNDKGQLDSNPNKLVGINNLRNRTKAKFDKYNMADAVAKGKESFGKFETIARKIGSRTVAGMLTKFSDPTLKNDEYINRLIKSGAISKEDAASVSTFPKTLDAWLESQLSMYNVSSLLTDNLRNIGGKAFKYTANPEEQDENTILYKQVDGNIVLDFESEIGKKQREIAKEGLKTVLLGALDHTESTTTVSDYNSPTYQPQYMYEANQTKKQTQDAISQIGQLWGGYNADIQGAVNYFRDFRPGIKEVTRDANGITVTYTKENGQLEQKTIPFYSPSGNLLDQEQFIKAAAPLLTGQKDISTALIKGGYIKNAEFSGYETDVFKATTTSGNAQVGQQSATNNIQQGEGGFDVFRGPLMNLDFLKGESEVKSDIDKMNIQQQIPSFKVETTGNNKLKITAAGMPDLILSASTWTTSGGRKEANKLYDYIKEALGETETTTTSGVAVDAEGVPIK